MKRILICILTVVSCISCKSVKSVEESIIYKDNDVYHTEFCIDSVYIKDSIFVRSKNDTVFIDRWHYDYKYKDNTVTDTIKVTDIQYIDRDKIVTKKVVPWWCWMILIICVFYVAINIMKKLRVF